MVTLDYISRSLDDTAQLAERVLSSFPRPLILALSGDLGSGKTTFIQSLAATLGVKGIIQSPTFTLSHEYILEKGHFVHADLYRIQNADEAMQLGLTDYFTHAETIVAVEWADRAADIFPQSALWLHFVLSPHHRVVRISKKDGALSRYLSLGGN